jgi:predicted nucleic acid-binding protein
MVPRILRRTGSQHYISMRGELELPYAGRILGLDRQSAILAGKVLDRRESVGRAISVQDAMIAAICLAHGTTLATRNTKDFEGLDLKLVNPFEDG